MDKSPVVTAEEGEHSGTKEVQLPNPKISLSDLIFVICVDTDAKKLSLVRFGDDLKFGSNGRFLIEVEDLSGSGVTKSGGMDDVTIKWRVVYKRLE
ncbi:unnamed protein product [Arabis nemorensis]|uniref:Uncharacterized protein n=1 Tax=Arabis nemorensis TaxID=586526 RepID=A0A565CHZ0_9BRAS|nr:unnamed protein product [Arabis nemorensis]